ncbi:hypothetical protein V1477_017854 [Vespula maculifrons]|uniref:Uncharacterized protein n=1 Tax=Vespula maculifrons TaxID=7453 RepID=A0ABD2B155_VESMC
MGVEGATSPFQRPQTGSPGKCFFPLNPLNRYNSAPIGPIWTKKIWAYRSRRALSNDPGPRLLCATVSEKKIVKKMFLSFVPFKPKCFFPLFPLNRYNSAPIGPIWTKKIWAYRSRRALSNDPSSVLLGAIVSEKKIVKEKCFFPLFPLNRYNSAPIGPIWTKKIRAYRSRRALSKDSDPVLLGATVSEKKIVKENVFFHCSL